MAWVYSTWVLYYPLVRVARVCTHDRSTDPTVRTVKRKSIRNRSDHAFTDHTITPHAPSCSVFATSLFCEVGSTAHAALEGEMGTLILAATIP